MLGQLAIAQIDLGQPCANHLQVLRRAATSRCCSGRTPRAAAGTGARVARRRRPGTSRCAYDAFGVFGTTLRVLHGKRPIFPPRKPQMHRMLMEPTSAGAAVGAGQRLRLGLRRLHRRGGRRALVLTAGMRQESPTLHFFLQHPHGKQWRFPVTLPGNAAVLCPNAPLPMLRPPQVGPNTCPRCSGRARTAVAGGRGLAARLRAAATSPCCGAPRSRPYGQGAIRGDISNAS
jgi:hypothetical protein